jgi:hypothetical protein
MAANPPESGILQIAHWAVLAVWIGVESAERRIFHQDTSSGPRVIHAVSKTSCQKLASTHSLVKTDYRLPKSAISAMSSAGITCFHPFGLAPGPRYR